MIHSSTPQLRAMSSNTCPNAEPRGLTDLSTCDPNALTTWGYCTECWTAANVPSRWADQVDRAIVLALP